jgi:hypothetical protein
MPGSNMANLYKVLYKIRNDLLNDKSMIASEKSGNSINKVATFKKANAEDSFRGNNGLPRQSELF